MLAQQDHFPGQRSVPEVKPIEVHARRHELPLSVPAVPTHREGTRSSRFIDEAANQGLLSRVVYDASRSGLLHHAVDELHALDDLTQEFVTIELPPVALRASA